MLASFNYINRPAPFTLFSIFYPLEFLTSMYYIQSPAQIVGHFLG
uniref:Uncharacterized protein n=1 Tax=Rhizophora mucronata TaxID=61149 RepID=A0A2P2PGI4_RHIMU